MIKEIEDSLLKIVELYPESCGLFLCKGSAMDNILSWSEDEELEDIRVKLFLKDNGPVAWAWLQDYSWSKFKDDEGFTRIDAVSVMIYVDENHRRQGLGSKLFKWAEEKAKDFLVPLVVFPWDESSETFYDSVEAKNRAVYY